MTLSTDLDRSIGAWLTVLRSSHVLSVRQVAERAGLTVERLAALEAGSESGTLAELSKVATVLGTSVLDFLLPAFLADSVPWTRAIDESSWVLLLNRCAYGISDDRALALLLHCASALREFEAHG